MGRSNDSKSSGWAAASPQRPAACKGKAWRQLVLLLLLAGFGWVGSLSVYLLGLAGSPSALVNPNSDKEVIDFVWFYAGSLIVSQRQFAGLSPYQGEALTRVVRAVSAPLPATGPYYLQYPPYFFALLQPLTWLPAAWAWAVWVLLQAVLTVASVWLVASKSFADHPIRVLVVLAVLGSLPCMTNLRFGQTAALPLFGLSLFWAMACRRRSFSAGASGALCLFKLQFVPLTLLPGLAAGRLRYLSGFILLFALLLGVSACVMTLSELVQFPAVVVQGEAVRGPHGMLPQHMTNLRALLILAAGSDSGTVRLVSMLAFAVAVLVSVVLLLPYAGERLDWDNFAASAATSMLVLFALNPHVYLYDNIILCLPALILFPALRARAKERGAARASAIVLMALIAVWPIAGWLGPMFFTRGAQQRCAFFAIYSLLLAGLALMSQLTAGRSQSA